MKVSTNLLVMTTLYLGLTLQPNGIAYSQSDGGVLEFIPAFIAGVKEAKIHEDQLFVCKRATELSKKPIKVYCGLGGGGYVDTFYVLYIDEKLTPAKSGPEYYMFDITHPSDLRPLVAEDCNASKIEKKIIGFSDLPTHVQDAVAIPNGKQAVYHRLRVWDGNGTITLGAIYQLCVGPE